MTAIFNPSNEEAEAGRLSSRPGWMIYVDPDSKNKQRQQKEEALLQSELQLKTDTHRKNSPLPQEVTRDGETTDEKALTSSQGPLEERMS